MPSTASDIAAAYPNAAPIADDIVALANKLGMPDPGWLANLMRFETGGSFDPGQYNKAGSGAVGLIQFTRTTAEGLGTSTEELAQMSQKEQMYWVEKFLVRKLRRGTFKDPTDVYMSVFYPVAMGKGPDFDIYDHKLRTDGQTEADRYLRQNGGIRTARDYTERANRKAKLPTGLEDLPETQTENDKNWLPYVIIGASAAFLIYALIVKSTK